MHDTCYLKSNHSLIAVVERTYHDLNSHEPVGPCLIICHVPVPPVKLIQFLTSGVPPLGFLFVKFAQQECGSSLIAEADALLLSRTFNIGDTVKRDVNDVAMVGTITSVHNTYTLQPICRVVHGAQGPTPEFYDIDPGRTERLDGCASGHRPGISPHRSGELLYRIPGTELKSACDIQEGDYVVDQEWLGVVQDCDVEVVLLLDNNTVVMVEHPLDLELIIPDFKKYVVSRPVADDLKPADELPAHQAGIISMVPLQHLKGQYVVTNRQNVRCGRWLYGEYDSSCKPRGRILEVRTKHAEIQWLCPNAFAPAWKGGQRPPSTFRLYENLSSFRNVRDLRRNKELTVYDRGRLPTGRSRETQVPAPRVPSKDAVYSGQDFEPGDHVRFRDQAGAVLKYNGRSPVHGTYNRVPREIIFDFDVNEFKIVYGFQWARVRWQDGSTTTELAKHLTPYSLPESELCPGDVIMLKEGTQQTAEKGASTACEFNEMLYFQGDYILRPAKVGVIQTLNAHERLLRVRWFADPQIKLIAQGHLLSADSRFGIISDIIEEVSMYEIMTFPAFIRRRRDLVIVPPLRPSQRVVRSILELPLDPAYKSGPMPLSTFRQRSSIDVFRHLRHVATLLITPPSRSWFNVSALPDQIKDPVLDWIGEIVDLGLDGTVTVRLGARSQCLDFLFTYERILMVVDEEAAEEDFSDEEGDWWDYEHEPVAGGTESDYDSPIEETVEYEGGERLDDDSGDEMWTTDDEAPTASKDSSDKDEDMVMNATNVLEDTMRKEAMPPRVDLESREEAAKSRADYSRLADVLAKRRRPEPAPSIADHRPKTEPPSFLVLDTPPPSDQFRVKVAEPAIFSSKILSRINKEHRILASSLPPGGIYVRTYESRLDLLRCLIIGPSDTPYEHAPFVIDLHLGPQFPKEPPTAHFHSWTGGLGRINPNLYEEGKICLSLLGTWPGQNEGENWTEKASILQVLVSLMGLVLVKQPFYSKWP